MITITVLDVSIRKIIEENLPLLGKNSSNWKSSLTSYKILHPEGLKSWVTKDFKEKNAIEIEGDDTARDYIGDVLDTKIISGSDDCSR